MARLAILRVFLFLSTCLAVSNCSRAGTTVYASAASREDAVSFQEFAELIPGPGLSFSTAKPATVVAMFVAESRHTRPGELLEVQITLDGVALPPGSASFAAGSTHQQSSHVAVLGAVPPGRHQVVVRCRVSRGIAFVRNRSLTVWVSPAK